MKLKRTVLFILLSVFLVGCSSNNVVPVERANSASCPEARAVIPITYYDGGFIPVFQVQDTENGRSLNLGFDSGFSYNAMYSSMVDEEFKVESQSLVEEHIRSQHPELSPKKVERLAKQMIESGYIGANVSGLQVDSMEFATQEFRYEPVTAFKNQTIDGMVGLEFFGECRTITIDYVNHVIVLDAPPIRGESLPMSRSEFHTLYTIPVTIDGGLEDGGAGLRQHYGKGAHHCRHQYVCPQLRDDHTGGLCLQPLRLVGDEGAGSPV